MCEDVSTSYWRRFGGGYKRRGTFIEYSKNFIDYLNASHSKQPRKLAVSDFTRSVTSLHYYDSIVVLEKGPREKPTRSTTGTAQIPYYEETRLGRYNRFKQRLRRIFSRA
jgi:hypothetical protein